jgi:alanine dehydrogenase
MNGNERVYKHDPLTKLLDSITESGRRFQKKRLRFLLDTDRNIENETRVGLTPEHIKKLIAALNQCGIVLEVSVAQAAGIWAGFRDRDFEGAGAKIVDWQNLASLEPFDVVHALKEPVEHEAEIKERFIRIGALHLASRSAGVGEMLSRKKFSALFDGSTVGSCSYLLSGAEETPIVASMSQLAGMLASERILKIGGERLRNERVLIVGAGYAGISAMLGLRDKVKSLTVVETNEQVRTQQAWLLRRLGFSEFAIVDQISTELLRGSTGVIFAHRRGADPAFKVCTVEDIMEMEQGSVVVDIAVDQGGSIACPDILPKDDVYVRIEKYKKALKNYCYFAEPNMPCRRPREASKRHGDAVLPYIVALHLLCAEHGDPVSATEYILKKNVQRMKQREELISNDFFECVVQDLRNGLQVISDKGELKICDPAIADNAEILDFVTHPTRTK